MNRMTMMLATLAPLLAAVTCNTQTPTPPPAPTQVPSITTPSPEPPPAPAPAPSAQDPSVCPQVCADAQKACKKHAPNTLDHCLGKCRDSAGVAVPSLACLAIIYTCNEDCPP